MTTPVFSLFKTIMKSEAGRRQPHLVLSRVAGWQLWRRVMRKPMYFKAVTGSRLRLLPRASDSMSSFWYHELPDFEEMAFTLHLLKKGDLFVDVGANQGGWSLTAAGRGARVFSFEPVPLTRERMLQTIAANRPEISERIKVFALGLSDQAGHVSFTSDLDAGNHRLRDRDKRSQTSISVELARADNLLQRENPVVIKIDVEGEELSVLEGARETLAKASLRAVVMETFRPSNYNNPTLIAAEAILAEHGLIPVTYDPWTRELQLLKRPDDGGQNTIYVKESSDARARLRAADPIKAFGKKI